MNEILNVYPNLLILQYSSTTDGKQNIKGKEQEAVCVRYVDHDLVPHETFLGFYQISSSTGETLVKVVTDVALRLNLEDLSGVYSCK